MSGYVFPCKTNGDCRKLMFNSYGWSFNELSIPLYGTRRIFGIKFKCCTQCHLPLNNLIAERLNKELGYSLNDVEIDSDFMDLLNGIE